MYFISAKFSKRQALEGIHAYNMCYVRYTMSYRIVFLDVERTNLEHVKTPLNLHPYDFDVDHESTIFTKEKSNA